MKTRWIIVSFIITLVMCYMGYVMDNGWLYWGALVPLRITAGGFFGRIYPLQAANKSSALHKEES